MYCNCEGKCHCWVGEGVTMHNDMKECYENIIWLQNQPPTPEILKELDETWLALFSAEKEIDQHINDFINDQYEYMGPPIYPPQHLIRGNRMQYARRIRLLKIVMDAVLIANKNILEFKKAQWGTDNAYHHYSNKIHDPHYNSLVWTDLRYIIELLKS